MERESLALTSTAAVSEGVILLLVSTNLRRAVLCGITTKSQSASY
jgi:hypothetical protein